MANDKLKNLVKQIQKYASPPPPPPAGYTSSGPAPSGGEGGHPMPTHGGTSSNWGGTPAAGNTTIMAMQQALQDLSQTVMAQINLTDITNVDPNDPNKVRKEQEAKSRDAFGVFLAKNFMRNSKVPGVEYDPNPHVTDVSKKSPDDPTRMSVVMDTMNRVGNPKKGEKFDDGQWGPRTNAAVRDAYAFASGLFDFVNDINRFATKKMQITSYSRENLQNLAPMATVDNSLTPEQKSEDAPIITQHVKAIKNMYVEVKNKVLEHPAYQQFIEGSVSYKSYAPKVTQQQIDILRKAFPEGFSVNLGGNQANIAVDALASADAFRKAIQHVAPGAAQANPLAIIDQIATQKSNVGSASAEPQRDMVAQNSGPARV